MEGKKQLDFNISNKALDIAAEGAKGFLQTLLRPSVESLGLLLKEKVDFWRFKNEVNTLNKTKDYVRKKGFDTHEISPKILLPLLEFSSLEDDENMQNKWAALLASEITDKTQSGNSIFTIILSQMSPRDAHLIELIWKNGQSMLNKSNSLAELEIKNLWWSAFYVGELVGSEDYSIELDNLLRLRLVSLTGSTSGDDQECVLTTLGYKFIMKTTLH